MLRLIWAELKKVFLNIKFVIAIVAAILLSILLFANIYSGSTRGGYSVSPDIGMGKPGGGSIIQTSQDYIPQILGDLDLSLQSLDTKLERMEELTRIDAKQRAVELLNELEVYNTDFLAAYDRSAMSDYTTQELFEEGFLDEETGNVIDKYLPLVTPGSDISVYLQSIDGIVTDFNQKLQELDALNNYILYQKNNRIYGFRNTLSDSLYYFGYTHSDLMDAYNDYKAMQGEDELEEWEPAYYQMELRDKLQSIISAYEGLRGRGVNSGLINDWGMSRAEDALWGAVGYKITVQDYAHIKDVVNAREVSVKSRLNEIYDRIGGYIDVGLIDKELNDIINKERNRYTTMVADAGRYADSYAIYAAIKADKGKNFADYSLSMSDSEYRYKSVINSFLYILDNGLYTEGYYDGIPNVEGYSMAASPMSISGFFELSFFGAQQNMYTFINFMMMFLSMVIIAVCVVIGGGQIAGEQQSGTIKMLIIRPYKRWKILTAKLLSTLIIGVGLLLATVILLLLIGWVSFGYGLTAPPVFAVFNASRVVIMPAFAELMLQLFFVAVSLVVYIVISTLFSVLMKSRTAAVVVAILLNMVGGILVMIFPAWWPMRLLIFANTDLYSFFGGGILDGSVFFGFSAAVCLAYILAFGALAYYTFNKRDLN